MEIALVGLQWTSCLIYLDDLVVFGIDWLSTTADLLKNLPMLFDL
jgi:hypothetical protein